MATFTHLSTQSPPQLLSIDQVAAWAAVNPMTVRKWIEAGHLKAVRLGDRLLRVPATELERLASHGT
jgi:excisionase family DNA binding protein